MADDLLLHRVADIAVRAVLQVAVCRGIALKRQQRPRRAVGKVALFAERIERAADKQVVAVIEQDWLTVGQPLAALQRRDRRALSHFWQGNDACLGPILFNFGVDAKVSDVFFQHNKGDIGAVHIFFHASRRPVKERLAANFNQRFRADEPIFKKSAPPPGHG